MPFLELMDKKTKKIHEVFEDSDQEVLYVKEID